MTENETESVAADVGWVILRTASRHTMRLSASLSAAGIEAWTPIEPKMIRIPRKNVKRQITVAMMPSYVFARADRLLELHRLADPDERARHGAGWAHPEFRIMIRQSGAIRIADRHFNALRMIEAKRARQKKADRTFPAGARVRVDGGIAGGLAGLVSRSNRKQTVVVFFDGQAMTMPTSILCLDDVGEG